MHKITNRFSFRKNAQGDDSRLSLLSLISCFSSTSTLVDDHLPTTGGAQDPFSRLPFDVIRKIFVAGKSMQDVEPENRARSLLPFEVTVSHVARCWRSISVSSPTLWSTIDTHYTAPCGQLAALEAYMCRSLGCTLDIRLDLSAEVWEAGVAHAVLESVVCNAHRWRRLAITAGFREAEWVLRGWLSGVCAPVLGHLSIICFDVPELPPDRDLLSGNDFQPQILNSGAPAELSVVRLQGIGMHKLRPPLGGVTTLYLEACNYAPVSYSRFRAMLDALPSLVNLSIYGSDVAEWPGDLVDRAGEIAMPALRSLRSCEDENLCMLLLAVSAPRMDSLVLKNSGPHAQHRLGRLLERSRRKLGGNFPVLRSFTLDVRGNRWCAATTCRRILDAFPEVVHLTLVGTADGVDAFVDLLPVSDVVRPRGGGAVEVEVCATLPRWPPGSDHDDDDDMFISRW